jgi:hypothetical protein
MFTEETFHELTLSPLEVLAKISRLLESVRGWEETEAALSLRQFDLCGNADQEFLSGKMLKGHSVQTLVKTLRQSSKSLPTLGAIDLNGNCLIHRGFYPKIESGYTLSDILQPQSEVGEEFFLSEKQVNQIANWNAQQKPLQNALLQEDKKDTQECNSLK